MDNIFDVAINIYHYGSYVYGTYIEGISDKDYIIIVPDTEKNEQFKYENVDYNIYTESEWIKKIKNNDIECLECTFLDKKYIVKESKQYPLKINKELVRKNISSVASNSFVKCKKKLIIKDSYNPRIGKKSLWHSIRLLDFGAQIMNYGKIINYQSANKYYEQILNSPDDWNYLKEHFQPIYNKYHSEFKIAHNKSGLER